jgi:hypothetical protein
MTLLLRFVGRLLVASVFTTLAGSATFGANASLSPLNSMENDSDASLFWFGLRELITHQDAVYDPIRVGRHQ